jgi:hypothetical protein
MRTTLSLPPPPPCTPLPLMLAVLLDARRSTRLSTAMLEAAQASTLDPRATSCKMISTTAVVLPVPEGARPMGARGH